MSVNLFDNPAYPVVSDKNDMVSALQDPRVRAVTLRDPRMAIDSSKISAVQNADLAQLYWYDESLDRKRRASGRITHLVDLSLTNVTEESCEAGIVIDPDTLAEFTERCNACRALFKNVFEAYTGLKETRHRGYTLFTPAGGRGRAPELHIDNTILTLHWAAALATFSLCNGEPDEQTWNAMKIKNREAQFDFLVAAAANPALDIRDNQINDLIITKGQRHRDLDDPAVRQSVCAHVSSNTIIKHGQVGFLMTPITP